MRKSYLVALAGLAAVTIACGTGDKTSTGGAAPAATAGAGHAADKPKTAKVGQPARDGKFEFTVKRVKCGVAKVGTSLLNEQAQGQFCLVTISVRNIGTEAQTFSDSSQKGYDAKGAEYSADSTAGLYANKNADVFLKDVNPGNAVTGVVVFDIPKGAKLTRLELHDSPFSGGVTVALS